MLKLKHSGVDVALVQGATRLMAETLGQVWSSPTGLSAYDTWAAEIQMELAQLQGKDIFASDDDSQKMLDKYRAGAAVVLASAGIIPSGKSDPASGISGGSGCWQDLGGSYWWELSDGYAPAFTNEPYYSTRKVTLDGTQEFGFVIKCGCEGRLKEGDRLTIVIGSGLSANVWGSNERLEIITIPTSPLYLTGGKNADDAEGWFVSARDASGDPLPMFMADAANRMYSSGGLDFTLIPGGIPFSVGDRFSFAVEGGTFRWRKDAGTWSAATPITDGATLDSGLQATFLPGAAPSFVTGDSFSFMAGQPASPTGLLQPDDTAWSWSGATAELTLSLPDVAPFTTLALLHSLPAGAAMAVDYSADGSSFTPLAWASGVLRSYLHVVSGPQVVAKVLKITVDAPGAIRWLWAGLPFAPLYSASLRLRTEFDVARAKVAGKGALLGEGTGASISWQALTDDEAEMLKDMVRSIKTGGDQPIILIPQYLHPEEAVICRLSEDGVEISDIFDYQPDNTSHRVLSANMELVPEWR